MKKNIYKVFLFFVILLIKNCEGNQLDEPFSYDKEGEDPYKEQKRINNTVKVKQTIMEQAAYYGSMKEDTNKSHNITKCFIDFYYYRFYYIDMKKINPNIPEVDVTFDFYLNKTYKKDKNKNETSEIGEAQISIRCSSNFTCYDIYLDEHEYVSFDFDRLITDTGGIIAFLLISMGLFVLFKGYIYFNITSAFYSGYSIFLLFREMCQLMEINHSLSSLHDASRAISVTVYVFSILTSVAYGYISLKIKYLRYISFGFIEGLIFAKALYYCLLYALTEEHSVFLGYFLIELLSCLCVMIIFTLFRNRYYIMTMINVCLLSSYGIVYGFHILIGGIPFLPFLIFFKTKYNESIDHALYKVLEAGDKIPFYFGAFWILAFIGFYFNYTGYKLFIQKKTINISTL